VDKKDFFCYIFSMAKQLKKKRRGRPRGEVMTVPVHLRLPQEQVDQLDAARGQQTRSEAIRAAISEWVARH